VIEHTTRAFDSDLHELARKIAEMGRLDGEQIADAIDALAKRDTALAKRVIAADDQVDALQREIEEKAATTIARGQPMAVDLREILGALRISNDLEREERPKADVTSKEMLPQRLCMCKRSRLVSKRVQCAVSFDCAAA